MFRKEENKHLWTSIYTLKPILFCPVRLKEPKHFPLPHLTGVPEDLSEQRTKLDSPLSMELWVFSSGGQKGGKTCLRQGQVQDQVPKAESSCPGQESEDLVL